MATHIVTRESLTQLVLRGDDVAMHAIGRALVHLLDRQTRVEAETNTTRDWNEVGFTGVDGRTGALSAKYYIKHGRLQQWQVDKWTKLNKRGVPRIAKYWKQIDEEAKQKAACKKAA